MIGFYLNVDNYKYHTQNKHPVGVRSVWTVRIDKKPFQPTLRMHRTEKYSEFPQRHAVHGPLTD